MMVWLSDEQWEAIDDALVAANGLLAVRLLQQRTGLGMREAADALQARWGRLRREHPEEEHHSPRSITCGSEQSAVPLPLPSGPSEGGR
jgi:hypothetical protein